MSSVKNRDRFKLAQVKSGFYYFIGYKRVSHRHVIIVKGYPLQCSDTTVSLKHFSFSYYTHHPILPPAVALYQIHTHSRHSIRVPKFQREDLSWLFTWVSLTGSLFFTSKKKTSIHLANGKGRFRTLGFLKSKPFIFSLSLLPRQRILS